MVLVLVRFAPYRLSTEDLCAAEKVGYVNTVFQKLKFTLCKELDVKISIKISYDYIADSPIFVTEVRRINQNLHISLTMTYRK